MGSTKRSGKNAGNLPETLIVNETENMDANEDMIAGYLDGRDPMSPPPSGNRSFSYRHGFANGRDDLRKRPRDTAENIGKMADEAMMLDDSLTTEH